ncbi:hypothetical protein R69746_08192 [Paraburkholderia aspalathi]|uniref:hypothetical protein n=1 Tax=Paraburkholderia aspalathi TaxID=1324617 RepID=UPI00190E22F0|nr:hypothetical protein [Paraburkholderia aspalathi]MBK3844129.1 hypothetical protein [Paraburkholderia aspalathi]CAE6867519.1 hypothetical protein R69746_08192 [Paraburkholderia aspalathi]
MKGEHDWSVKSLLPKAPTAGAISAAGSFPNNILQYKSTGNRGVDTAAGILTTEAAILSAASGIPLEVTESRDNTRAAIVQKMADGLFALPPLGTDEQFDANNRAAQIEGHVNTMASQAIALSPGDGIGQKSMAFAAIVGLIPLLLSNKVTNLVGEPVLRIMRSTVFNPIEAIALNFLVLSSRINIPNVMRSDYQKHAHAVARLFAEASAQSRPLKPGDLQRILDPNREALRHLGNGIVTGMSGLFDLLPALGRSAGFGEATLAQRIPYERLVHGQV